MDHNEFQKLCDEHVKQFHETGELPPAWTADLESEFDRHVEEINRELDAEADAIASGCVEPPRYGWAIQR